MLLTQNKHKTKSRLCRVVWRPA